MAWLEIHQSLQRHPKLVRLSAKLRVHKAQAAGHLLFLWLWSLDYSPTGNLSAFGPAEIAAAADFGGDAEIFTQALRDTGWMDPDNSLHDWGQYAGRLLQKRAEDRMRKQAERELPKDVRRTDNGKPADGARTIPYRTVPNHDPPTPLRGGWLQDRKFKTAWDGWIAARKKKPTDYALELSMRKLHRLAKDMPTAIAILEQSIENGWTGIFPISRNRFKGEPVGGVSDEIIITGSGT